MIQLGARLKRTLPFKILDRYLMRQFMIAYVICATAILGLIVLLEGLGKLDNFMKEEGSLIVAVARYFAATLPLYYCQYLAPVLTVMAAMFSINLLNKGCEITPMKACGLSMQRILSSFFFLGFVFTLVMVGMQEFVVPNFKEEIRAAYAYGKRGIVKDAFFPDSQGRYVEVAKYIPSMLAGEAVRIRTFHPNGQLAEIKIAERIEYHDPGWVLKNGSSQRWHDDGRPFEAPASKPEDRYVTRFVEDYFTSEMQPIDLETSMEQLSYASYRELRDQNKRWSKQSHIEVKLHMRFAFPLANIVLLMIGIPFVTRGEKRSVIVGVLAALLLSASYIFLTTICAELGNKGSLPPILAAWLPPLLFGALGVTLFMDIDGAER